MTMEQRRLGSTGVWVSELCLGTMMFGEWGTKDHDESIRIIHRALDAGINFVDTADVYSAGESEVIVGKALAGRRDDVVLATKVFMPMGDDPNHRGSSRRWIIREVEDSLRRLRHRLDRPLPDPPLRPRRPTSTRPSAPSPTWSTRARSATSATRRSRASADRRGPVDRPRAPNRERFVTEQPPYSILARGIENDILPTCQRYGMGVLLLQPARRRLAVRPLPQGRRRRDPHRPPASAWPTGSTSTCRRTSASSRPPTQLAQLADEAGITPDRARDRLRPAPPRRHLGDHRPPDHGTPRIQLDRRRRPPDRRRPRPHRRDRRRPASPSTPPTTAGSARALDPAARRR